MAILLNLVKSFATVVRPSRLILQAILRENLKSPVVRSQPITSTVVSGACLNTRWHRGASKEDSRSLGLDRVLTMCVLQSAQ